MKITKSLENSFSYLVAAVLAITVALLVSSALLFWQGISPWNTFVALFRGAFYGMGNFGASLVVSTPLLLAALGIMLAFRAGIFNIGAEGQLFVGAMVGTFVGVRFTGLPMVIHLPLALAASMAAGALWALIPAYLKVKKGFNEVITTILMNYIAIFLVNYSVHSFLNDVGTYAPQSPPVAPSAQLPRLMAGTELHAGILVALLAAFVLHIMFKRTDYGYQIKVIGSNLHAGRTAGMNSNRILILTMLFSGGLAGLAGGVEILGNQHLLLENFLLNTGYDAIAVALLGGLSPLGVVIAAVFLGSLRNGAITMQIFMGIPVTIIFIIQAIIILCVLGFANYKFDLRRIFERVGGKS
ncbi:MAG: hypothetical protein APF76_08520 [Desulfitibacter sp. BRH_c19]|nr:MAG: hypothetical protein APF76_08520 [Desulfitibacter sp. BRH_c19]